MRGQRLCLMCSNSQAREVRQIRVYTKKRQYEFRLMLCYGCFAGLMSMIDSCSDAMTDGLWNPMTTGVKWDGIVHGIDGDTKTGAAS